MTEPHILTLPLTAEKVRTLRVGDRVLLTGEVVITAGLPTHHRIADFLARGEPLPVDPGGTLLHLGGYSRLHDGQLEMLYVNPTTSTRFNPVMPGLIRGLGLHVVGGKGGLDKASVDAMREVGCVYLSFIGGGCTILSQAIREVIAVGWDDMPIHFRLARIRVDRLGPATVGIDAHGHSLYESGTARALERLPDIMARLNRARATSAR